MPATGNRRPSRRAKGAGKHPTIDVSRLEFENLYSEIEGLLKGVRRIENDVQRLTDRVHKLERRHDKSDK